MPKLTLKQICVLEDKGEPKGYGPGEVEVSQEVEKQLKAQFAHAIVKGESAKAESRKDGE
jgi:hypothetical protein